MNLQIALQSTETCPVTIRTSQEMELLEVNITYKISWPWAASANKNLNLLKE